MKENNVFNTQNISQRAQNILKNPQSVISQEIDENWNWVISFENKNPNFQNDKILTLRYSGVSSLEDISLFLESISRLSVGKSLDILTRLSFREVENFLRDENHLPAFPASEEILLEKSFKMVKNTLLSALIFEKINKNEDIFPKKVFWNDLTFVEKNRRILSILEVFKRLFPLVKSTQLALAEADGVSIVKNDLPLDIEVIKHVIQELNPVDSAKTLLKVVATL